MTELVEVGDGHVQLQGEFKIVNPNDLDNGFGDLLYPWNEEAQDIYAWLMEQAPSVSLYRFFNIKHPQQPLSTTLALWYGSGGRVLPFAASAPLRGPKREGSATVRARLREFFDGAGESTFTYYPGLESRKQAKEPSPFGEPVAGRSGHWWVHREAVAQYPHTVPASGKPVYKLIHPVERRPFWFAVVYIQTKPGSGPFGTGGVREKAFLALNAANV